MNQRPLLLVVLDGFGHREQADHNAVLAEARFVSQLRARYPHTLLSASGEEVGLPLGLMGNSEVGHMNLGAGRVVYQDITRIDLAIREGEFFRNGVLKNLARSVRQRGSVLHLLGLVSDGGVHSSDAHLESLLELFRAEGLEEDRVRIHAILDGRDTPPRSGVCHLEKLLAAVERIGVGRLASVIGRYWAMDRDRRWERVQKAYELFVHGRGEGVLDPLEAVRASYASGVGDEFVEPLVIGESGGGGMKDGDGVFCFNFRADRMRQIAAALGCEEFDGFERGAPPRLEVATMTQYRGDFPFPVAFPPVELRGTFGEVVSAAGLRQERIAETEKYAHVTFFFSGGNEDELPGETRTLIPSPKVATYDLQPQMSAPQVTEAVLASLDRGRTDVYVVNFANADMVGHTGIEDAARAAVRAVDGCLSRIVPRVTKMGGIVAITADHGNAEEMWDEQSGQPHTAHTTNPVPLLLCCEDLVEAPMRPMGILADVVPTLCQVVGIETPEAMTGVSLLR